MKRSTTRLILAGAVALMPLGLSAANAAAASSQNVNVVGYSVLSPSFTALEKAFQATPAGANITFTNSFGASTTQAEDVVAGQPADVVIFSQIPDLQLLVNAGLVASNWKDNATGRAEGNIVTDSVVAFLVRQGNPLHVTSWNSLTKKGVQIVTPDPISSGSARWNLVAAYESQLQQHKRVTQAKSFLNSLIGHVVAEPSSGSKSLSTFESGTGNVLLAYEADALAAVKSGQAVQVVEPPQDLLIQNPSALTTTGQSSPAATAFYQYLYSTAGQTILVQNGFRSTVASLQSLNASTYSTPQTVTTIAKLGGWNAVDNIFFSANGIATKDEKAHGYTS